MKWKASIIIPAYNAEKSIVRCMESVLQQTYHNFEVIVVDDGSTDNTGHLLDKIAAADDRVKVFHIQNGGVSVARNFALKQLSGHVVTFVDSDDIILPEYLEKMIDSLYKNDVDLAICRYEELNYENVLMEWPLPQAQCQLIHVETEYDFMAEYAHYMVWAAIFKADLLRDIAFDNDIFVAEDSLFFVKALKKCHQIAALNQPLYGYVIYPVSACHGEYDEKKFTEIVAWKRIVTLFSDKSSPTYNSVRTAFALRCFLAIRRSCVSKTRQKSSEKIILYEARKNWRFFMNSNFNSKIKVNYTVWCILPRYYYHCIKAKNPKKEIN